LAHIFLESEGHGGTSLDFNEFGASLVIVGLKIFSPATVTWFLVVGIKHEVSGLRFQVPFRNLQASQVYEIYSMHFL
jgi:hypothetical protein